MYYTTFDFDIFAKQHLILTFLLHNIWFRPFDYTTLGFDRFITPDSILICCRHDGARGACSGGRVQKKPKFGGYDDHMVPESAPWNLCLVGQCTTKPNFAVRCTEIPNIKNIVESDLEWVYRRTHPKCNCCQSPSHLYHVIFLIRDFKYKTVTPGLRKGVKGAVEVHTHLGAEEVYTLLWHVRFLIRAFMHKTATTTLCLNHRDHIGLRTVPPSYNCRPHRKSLIFATEQKFWFFFGTSSWINMRQSCEIFEIFGFWREVSNFTRTSLEYIVKHKRLESFPAKKNLPRRGHLIPYDLKL